MEPIQISLGSVRQTGSQINGGLSIVLTLRGAVFLKSPDLNRWLTENQFAVINHNDFFSLDSDGPNVVLWVNMDRSWLQTVCPETAEHRYFCCSTLSAAASEPLYDGLRRSITRAAMYAFRREEGYWLLLQAQLLKALHTLLLHFRSGEQSPYAEGPHKRLAPILNYLRLNYRETITLESTAKQFYVSTAHLSRTFRQELGVTFLAYLTSLRLESAQRELLYSGETLTRIALNNGFSSPRAMGQQFQRTYGCTPAAYRRQAAERSQVQPLRWLGPASDGSLETLARFMDTYEAQGKTGVSPAVVTLAPSGAPLVCPELIIDVGEWDRVLWRTVQAQLELAQKAIHFQYIRLSGVFLTGTRLDSQLESYSFLNSFEELLAMGLTPMIRVDPEAEGEALSPVLELLLARLGQQELSHWKFELCPGPDCPSGAVRQAACVLRGLLRNGQVGLHLVPEHLPHWAQGQDGPALLALTTDFVTTRLDPNTGNSPSDALTFERYHHRFFENKLRLICSWLSEHSRQVPVYLVDWNTLTGRSIVEAGEFHRTALIADVLLGLREQTAGFGFRLDIREEARRHPELPSYAISLYLYRQIRRPLFFILSGYRSLGREVLWEGPGLLVTRRRPGRYIALAWNPCYIDPFQSLENLRLDMYQRTVRLQILGLEPGRYRLKCFLIDKEHGSTYRSWLKIDLTAYMDADVMEYLEHSSTPTVTLEERVVERELEMVQPLSLNAAALWSIRRIEAP